MLHGEVGAGFLDDLGGVGADTGAEHGNLLVELLKRGVAGTGRLLEIDAAGNQTVVNGHARVAKRLDRGYQCVFTESAVDGLENFRVIIYLAAGLYGFHRAFEFNFCHNLGLGFGSGNAVGLTVIRCSTFGVGEFIGHGCNALVVVVNGFSGSLAASLGAFGQVLLHDGVDDSRAELT